MPALSCYHAVKRTNDGARPASVASYINAVFVCERPRKISSLGVVPQEEVAKFLRKYKDLADKNPESEIIVTIVTFADQSHVAYSGHAKNVTRKDIEEVKRLMIPLNQRCTTRIIDNVIEEIEKQAKALVLAKQRWHDSREAWYTHCWRPSSMSFLELCALYGINIHASYLRIRQL